MSNIDEVLNKINSHYSIDELMKKYLEDKLNDDEEQILIELFDALRNFKKINDINLLTFLDKMISNKKTIKEINRIIENSLINYHKVNQLRILESKDIMSAKLFIISVFDLYILRQDPNFLDEYQKYHFDSSSQMQDVLSCLDYLMNFYISRCFVKSYVINDLKDELGLSDELTLCLGNLYEKYFDILKQNYILYKVRMLGDKIATLEDKIKNL